MIQYIDQFIAKTNMFRLVLYYLIFLVIVAALLSFFGVLPYSGFNLIFSAIFLILIGWVTNTIFAKTFGVRTNPDSVYISALILVLIITPLHSFSDIPFFFWAAVLTMASKFIVTSNKKHIFNPVAFAVFLTSIAISQSASWWVGNLPMLPAVLVGGWLIVRKIKRGDLVFSFMVTSIFVVLVASFLKGTNVFATLERVVFYSPWLFFAFVMLTEPLTMPQEKKSQIIYGVIVGFLFVPQVHIGSLYTTPEIALLIGNLYSFIVRRTYRLNPTN